MQLQLSIPPDTSQFRAVRRVLEGWASAHDVAAESLTLIATELLANAVAVAPPDDRILLSVELRDQEVALSVSDGGPGGPERADVAPVGPRSIRGRGLHIVRGLSNRLEIDRTGGRTVVTAYQYRRMLGPLPTASGAGDRCDVDDRTRQS